MKTAVLAAIAAALVALTIACGDNPAPKDPTSVEPPAAPSAPSVPSAPADADAGAK